MKINFTRFFLFPVLFFFSFSGTSYAAHIIGGDISVRYLSPNNFQVTVTFFRDCGGGGASFDSPMYVGVYDRVTHTQNQVINMGAPVITSVTLGDACYTPSICMQKGIYTANIVLSNNPNGYYLSWLRCCRNATISNIVTPGNDGYVLYAEIPDPSIVNSTPVFTGIPDAYMCQNYLNTDNFTATDADGDVLVYSFSTPLSCSATLQCDAGAAAQPSTAAANLPGPYGTIIWNPGYSTSQPTGDPAMAISSSTGIVTNTPPNLGIYVMCVTVEEWRGGVKIGEIRRDFQFQVLGCQILSINVSPTTTVCQGQIATLTGSGALPGWTYSWNPGGQTGPIATGMSLVNGTTSYTATATNGVACIMNVGSFITNSPTAVVATSGNICLGQNTTLTASGGTSYVWSNGTSASVLTGVANSTYTVTATNANGCTDDATGVIYQAPVLTSTVTVSNTPCTGNPASATISASNGSPGYTYSWTSGGQTTQTATGIGTGNYSITVTDSRGCTSVKTFSVSVTSVPALSMSSSPGGCGVSIGSATVSPSGGGGAPYTYLWDDGQTNQTATGLANGNYSVTVTSSNGCTNTNTVSISALNGPAISTATSSIAGCSISNGTATVNATGGTPGYTYSWIPGGQTDQTATGLSGGNYTVTISDQNGCSVVTTVSVSTTSAPTATTSVNQASCGNNNGTATANPSGGTPGYTYSWSNGQTAQTATGLTAGLYTVTITDANGCTTSDVANISNANGPTATSTVNSNVSCFGGNSGNATANPSGGTPGYTYLWSNGQTSQTATGLTSGNYSVTITDANGCPVIATAVISQPSILSATTSQTSILCNGGTASASVTPAGGTPAYTYNWSSGQTTSAASPMSSGSYTVLVTDANGCTYSNVFSFTQPAALTSVATQTAILCNGGSGSASVITAGGTPAYTYNWSSGQTTSAIAGIAAGNYSVTITDVNGCTSQAGVSLTQPTSLLLSVSGNDSICAGDTAVLNASASGGTPNYTYTWIPGPQIGQSVSVSPGSSTTYSAIITDANGCTSTMQTVSVALFPNPNALFDTLSNGLYGAVYSFDDQSTGSTSWYWTFGDGSSSTLQNPVHTFPGAGTYTVTQIVFNPFGCPDTFLLVIDFEDGILIPNVFTPDGDGINDVWYIPNSGLREFHVDIYDRWGLKVFETTADEIRWDGYSSAGKLLSDGTYYYVLKAILKSFNGDKDYSTKGHVTLLTTKRK